MDTIRDSMRAAMRISSPPPAHVPMAKDIMVSDKLITFRPHQRIADAIQVMIDRKISGAPVVDAQMNLLGILSEFDCLREIAVDAYEGTPMFANTTVQDLMSTEVTTIGPTLSLYGIVQKFITLSLRRLPVVEGRRVLGQVSRRDVLKAVRSCS